MKDRRPVFPDAWRMETGGFGWYPKEASVLMAGSVSFLLSEIKHTFLPFPH